MGDFITLLIFARGDLGERGERGEEGGDGTVSEAVEAPLIDSGLKKLKRFAKKSLFPMTKECINSKMVILVLRVVDSVDTKRFQ
jgi:hypothetical protein